MSRRADLRRQWVQNNRARQARGYAPLPWAVWKPPLGTAMHSAKAGRPVDVEITDLETFIHSKHNERHP